MTHVDYPTTVDALKTVFDSIVSESSINELSDVDDSDTDFKPKYNPDNLFRYRRSTIPTLTQRLRKDSLATTDWKTLYEEIVSTIADQTTNTNNK